MSQRNCSSDDAERTDGGRAFHPRAAATGNARSPSVVSRDWLWIRQDWKAHKRSNMNPEEQAHESRRWKPPCHVWDKLLMHDTFNVETIWTKHFRAAKDWTIYARGWCGLSSNYFDYLLLCHIIRPHRMHSVYKMCAHCYRWSSVVCVSVCLLVICLCPAKSAKPIEMLTGGVGTRNHVSDGKGLFWR